MNLCLFMAQQYLCCNLLLFKTNMSTVLKSVISPVPPLKTVLCDLLIVDVISSYNHSNAKNMHMKLVFAAHDAMRHHKISKPVTDIRPERWGVSSLYSQV